MRAGRRPARMAKPYSGDLRERVVRAVKAGHTHVEIAAMFKISERSVRRDVGLWLRTGSVLPHTKFGGTRNRFWRNIESKLKGLLLKLLT